ncbi:complexed with cef1p [Tyrophagus putrescentiae]|nr:complexed with cef1p [Tyrophagus putrescentiae]
MEKRAQKVVVVVVVVLGQIESICSLLPLLLLDRPRRTWPAKWTHLQIDPFAAATTTTTTTTTADDDDVPTTIMTTAARPTFDPAKGGTSRGEKSLSSLSKQYSSRDLPSHLKLKYRQTGQGTTDDLKSKDFRRELEERERLAKRDEERKLQENQIRMENILSGNPLLNAGSSKGGPSSFKVKRRWDDDVVFKNCAKGEGQNKRGFINDTLRSDFHRKFMEKYIK